MNRRFEPALPRRRVRPKAPEKRTYSEGAVFWRVLWGWALGIWSGVFIGLLIERFF